MHIGDTASEAAFRAEARAWLEANAVPKGHPDDFSVGAFGDLDEEDYVDRVRQWQRTLHEGGYAALTWPRAAGGGGHPPIHQSIFNQEQARFGVTVGPLVIAIGMVGPTLLRHGSPEQQARFLPSMLRGEEVWCQLFSEPGAGSDLASLSTRAERDGDEFVVTGQKVWNSAAQWCSRGMLVVRTDPDAPKHRGVTFLLVDMDSPGIEVRPLVQPTGAQEFNEVFLSEVRVPVANVLGEINDGWHVARTVLSNESAFIGGSGGRSVHERLVARARMFERTDDPVIRQGRATTYSRERILGFLGERIMAAVRRREVPPVDPSILKLYVAENAVHNGNLTMSITGAAGIAGVPGEEIPLWAQTQLLGRFGISIGGGTNEVQRNNLAERALGLPREMRDDHQRPWKDVPRS